MAKAAADLADAVYVTSDNPRTERPDDIIAEILAGMPRDADFTAICDRAEAIRTAIKDARQGDIVLIAGKGHEDYQEINGVKHPFDDRAVAAECVRQ
jgi:UDP-N-acetylmuramoyl-L-alanyl-D-glutamate--2,6-diaminopimelate ligase